MDKIVNKITSVFNLTVDWVVKHPRTALYIIIFVVGFILGTLF